MSQDRLINGKSDVQRIVSLEVQDSSVELFHEDINGNVTSSFLPNRFWILSSHPLSNNWIKLQGNLHYQWGIQFDERKEFLKYRKANKNKDIFSVYNSKESIMLKNGITYFKGMKHNEVSCLSFDIETTGLKCDDTSKLLIISNSFRKNGIVIRKLFTYDEYEDQGVMLEEWCKWVRQINPSIILGHNIFSFDFIYLKHIADTYGVELELGRDGSSIKFENYISKFRYDGSRDQSYHKVHCYGRELVDTMFLAIKYDVNRKYDSYGLKPIIKVEDLEVKDRQFYEADKIRFNYTIPEEWIKIKQYALHDADDALALYDLMSPPFFYLTQSVPKPYQLILESASGSQINAVMMRSYLQEGHSLPRSSDIIEFPGAISLGTPGIYNNVFKIDVASLYPSIMIQYKVYDEDKDPKGNFLKLVNDFTNRRLEHKKKAKEDKYYDDLQSAEKIFINSCYGFLGSQGLLFNSPQAASFITETGREILQTSIDWAINKGFKIVNADTDSISFCYPNSEEITESHRKELLKEINLLFPERVRFEDDGYYIKICVIKVKNYILFDGKKIKYKGSALKGGTKEAALKEFIYKVVDTILYDRNNFTEIYNGYIKEIMEIRDIKRWSSRKTISEKVLSSERTNEVKVRDAIKDTDYVEGDRVYMYFKRDSSLGLAETFTGDYHIDKMLEKLFKTAQVFSTILDTKMLFPNYKLRKNKPLLNNIINI